MAHKPAQNIRQPIKKIRQYLNLAHASKILKRKNFFLLINKEEDEDNEQTLWPFTGRSIASRLGFR